MEKEDTMAIITISRQVGTGGFDMARGVAKKISYRFFSRDELVRSCSEKGLTINIEKIEGRPPTIFERLFKINREVLVEKVREVMEEAVKDDNIVIAGWGGQILLKNSEDVFHIRIIGSHDTRVRYLMNAAGVTRTGAEETIRQADRDHSLFSQYFFNADFSDLKLYHFVLNLDQISHDEMTEMILNLVNATTPQST
jgi:cytidylate kinase